MCIRDRPLSLNRFLPDDIRVLAAREVPDDFHARYSAQSQEYLYRIWNSPVDDPFEAKYHWRISQPLNEAAMAREMCIRDSGYSAHSRQYGLTRTRRQQLGYD